MSWLNEVKSNIRQSVLNREIIKVVEDYVCSEIEEDYLGTYYGEVVDNDDPDKIGRCRIRIYNLFYDESGISDEDLPWSMPDFSFRGSLTGNFIVPPVGTVVNVKFDRGDVYCPRYTTKGISQSLPDQKDTDYPDNMVIYATDEGDYFAVNRSTKETKFHHNSGVEVSVDENGDLTINSTSSDSGKVTINTNGDTVVNSAGNVKIESEGTIEIDSKGGSSNPVKINGSHLTVE